MSRTTASVFIVGILLAAAAVAQEGSNTASQCGSSSAAVAPFTDMQVPVPGDQHLVTGAANVPTLTMTARTASSEDTRLIGDALQSYRSAFNGRNLAAVKQAWPAVDDKRQAKFKEVFEFFRKDSLTPNLALRCALPAVAGNQANVDCFQTLAYSDKKGKCHQVQPAEISIHMERASQTWVIQGMAVRNLN